MVGMVNCRVMLFTSDNWAGVHPAVMEALVAANAGAVPAYGADGLSEQVRAQFSELFETDCQVFFVTTGGAANGLALSRLVPPYGATFCHEASHIQMDEVGLPEFYCGGAKLLTLAGAGAKITPSALQEAMRVYTPPTSHHVRPKALSLTQGTEAGTLYTVAELKALSASARSYGMKVHMDGARFANAVARLECSPAELTWRAGVDVLSFGATKNGALAAEAVVFFDEALTEDFAWAHKRSGHVWSKGRFMAAQWQAYLHENLWLELASHANAMAQRLATGLLEALEETPGVEIVWPTEINEVFITLPDGLTRSLREAGAQFYDWVYPGDLWQGKVKRFVTSYATTQAEVDEFVAQVLCAVEANRL